MPLQHRRHRILILGCGYVGSALARRLVRDGHHVVATTTRHGRTPKLVAQGATPVVLSLNNGGALHEALLDRACVYLCVAAGRGAQSYHELYVDGARHLIEACRDTPVRRIVYTSSTRVYAQNDGSWVDEDSPTQPLDEDGQALLLAEHLLLNAPGDGRLPSAAAVSVLRLGGIHGPGRELSLRIQRAAGNIRSDGEAYVNLIHIDDLVEAMVRLLETPHHGVLNICDGQSALRRELYDREIARAGLAPIQWTISGGAPLGKRVRSDRLQHMLNPIPKPTA